MPKSKILPFINFSLAHKNELRLHRATDIRNDLKKKPTNQIKLVRAQETRIILTTKPLKTYNYVRSNYNHKQKSISRKI